MNKTLSILLVVSMILVLCACSSDIAASTTPTQEITTGAPTENLSDAPTTEPTTASTEAPTTAPTEAPTTAPTEAPTTAPTEAPTTAPTEAPTTAPTEAPTTAPTEAPTTAPTEAPTTAPTEAPTTAPTTCSHSYKDATCTTPKTCSKCGATSGDAAGHSYKDATCTTPKTCSKCGATSGDAAGHSYKDATCTTPKTCSKCGATSGDAAGHSYKDATCSTPKTCKTCGITTGDKLTHVFYAGECKNCKESDVNGKRIYSEDNTVSIFVPNKILNMSAVDVSNSMGGIFGFFCPSIGFEFIVTRAIVFYRVENTEATSFERDWNLPFGTDQGDMTNEDMGFALEKVTSNDTYTIYCQYISKRNYADGSEEDLVQFNALLDCKDELCKSVKFN